MESDVQCVACELKQRFSRSACKVAPCMHSACPTMAGRNVQLAECMGRGSGRLCHSLTHSSCHLQLLNLVEAGSSLLTNAEAIKICMP